MAGEVASTAAVRMVHGDELCTESGVWQGRRQRKRDGTDWVAGLNGGDAEMPPPSEEDDAAWVLFVAEG